MYLDWVGEKRRNVLIPRPSYRYVIWYVTNMKNHQILQQSQTKHWPELYVFTNNPHKNPPTNPP